MTSNKPIEAQPGTLIRSYIIKPYNLSVNKTAELLGLSQSYFSGIITGKWNLTLNLCHRIACRFNQNAEEWATRQLLYNLTQKGVGYNYIPQRIEYPNTGSSKPRPHPGKQLKQDVLKARHIKGKEAAGLLGVHPNFLSSIITGNADISLDMCLRLMREFGEKPEVWAIRQMQHDLDKEEIKVKRLNLNPYRPE